jgi:hypothetical protein
MRPSLVVRPIKLSLSPRAFCSSSASATAHAIPTSLHFHFGGPTLGAVRIDDFKFQFYQQPFGWPGEKTTTDMPTIVNLRQDPFERTPSIRGETLNNMGGGYMNDFFAREFWRFVLVQQAVANLAQTAINYPPMQAPASFNLEAV